MEELATLKDVIIAASLVAVLFVVLVLIAVKMANLPYGYNLLPSGNTTNCTYTSNPHHILPIQMYCTLNSTSGFCSNIGPTLQTWPECNATQLKLINSNRTLQGVVL